MSQKPAAKVDTRAIAATLIAPVIARKRSFDGKIPQSIDSLNAAFIRELCYGSLRWLPKLNLLLNTFLDKPLKIKDSDIQALMIVGLYQLEHLQTPVYAAISATVQACEQLQKPWAKGLVNAVLRTSIRRRETLPTQLRQQIAYRDAHPDWLVQRIQAYWGEACVAVIAAGNQKPPMTLRCRHRKRALLALEQQHILAYEGSVSEQALYLENPMPVEQLPGFSEGQLSVQDESAQLAAPLLQLKPGQRVLDACSAPGGKAGHCLELQPDIQLTALDRDQSRLNLVHDNLMRLNTQAHLICADASETKLWFDGQAFDRILLDAPCSGTGVLRRYPDIKWLRRPEDIAKFAYQQWQLLIALWPLLKSGGLLLYSTCSIMKEENLDLIDRFVLEFSDCQHLSIDRPWGIEQSFGRQLLPDCNGGDGFYYALLTKTR